MSKSIAIVGSGISGATLAYQLAQAGFEIDIFEKGPEYPYPHASQFNFRNIRGFIDFETYALPDDMQHIERSQGLPFNPERERYLQVGGSAAWWTAITVRMQPSDFKRQSLYGFGGDWPIDYDMLEPYYSAAEAFIGVSGSDDDNPFAPPRSQPYPLPPFELSWDDQILADRLRESGLIIHTTPQARTRLQYEDRLGCQNFNMCQTCPIGVRYSPNYHLAKALETGQVRIHPLTTVRRIVVDANNRATGLVIQDTDPASEQRQVDADIVIVAAGGIASPRLLLLSANERHPDGLGNNSGFVGKYMGFHHLWEGTLEYDQPLWPGRVGAQTGQSMQFVNPKTRGQHGGVKVELSTFWLGADSGWDANLTFEQALEARVETQRQSLTRRPIIMHAESTIEAEKYLRLSDKVDPFGDPYAYIHYEADSSEFDNATYNYSNQIFERFREGSGAVNGVFDPFSSFHSGAHHMGATPMSENEAEGVVNSFGEVHGIEKLFVMGSSIFVGHSGPMNPTLTIVALALRSADYIIDRS